MKKFIEDLTNITGQLKPSLIGSINFKSKLIMAPLAGITTSPFRELMSTCGAGGVVTELISSHAITHSNQKTLNMLRLGDEAVPAIQLFGNSPEMMATAAIIAAKYGAKYIDINMGCPVKKVTSRGAGAALMKTPAIAAEMIRQVKKSISIPVTIKIRLGQNEDKINAEEIVKIAQEEGAEFVTIHGRTLNQGYRGNANWDIIENIASKYQIPIVGNGDLFSSEKIKSRLKITNCKALMLGRGPLKNPFLFLAELDHNFGIKDYSSLIEILLSKMVAANYNDKLIITNIKKHAVWLSSGLPGASKFRYNVFTEHSLTKIMNLALAFFPSNENSEQITEDESFLAGGHG